MRVPGPRPFFLLTLLLIPALSFAEPPQSTPSEPAEDDIAPILNAIRGISLSGQWFLTYQAGEQGVESFNEFALRRGYITLKKKLSASLSGRITEDISVDQEGDGRGDVEMRLKYCYVKWALPGAGFFAKPYLEFGLVHCPWIDFEQKVNPYRVQGSMYLDRAGVLSSADYGLTFVSLFGGKVDEAYQDRVSDAYPGRFGSVSVGVFNGGGYHGIEENENKAVQGRLSIRPFPDRIPGLQFSAHGAYGKGNTGAEPDWDLVGGFASFEDERIIFTAQVFEGTGNYKGSEVDDSGASVDQDGLSLFADLRPWPGPVSVFGRYDKTDRGNGVDGIESRRTIAGIAYRLTGDGKVLIDYDHFDSGIDGDPEDSILELAVEVIY